MPPKSDKKDKSSKKFKINFQKSRKEVKIRSLKVLLNDNYVIINLTYDARKKLIEDKKIQNLKNIHLYCKNIRQLGYMDYRVNPENTL